MHTAILIAVGHGLLAALIVSVIQWRLTPRERKEEKSESQLW